MAYINEKSDGREFVIPVYGKHTPYVWTRDGEKDAILFLYYEERENVGRKYFFFQYKGYGINVILDGEEFVEPDTRKWKLISTDIPSDLSETEVLAELRQAVEVYGCNGSCFKALPTGNAIADF